MWYYPQNLLWMLAPWTPAALLGLGLTAKTARTENTSPARFLWCWAILVPAVFSIPQGKNHHYLLHALAPWSVLGTLGLIRLVVWFRSWPAFLRSPRNCAVIFSPLLIVPILVFRDSFVGPPWVPLILAGLCPFLLWIWNWGIQHRSLKVSARVVFLIIGGCYCTIHWAAGQYLDKHREDVAFLKSVPSQCSGDIPLMVDLDVDALRAFLCLFYLPEDVRPLHNLSFLKDDQMQAGEMYLLTRKSKIGNVPELSGFQQISQSRHTGGESSPEDRLTLFRCTLDPHRRQATSAGVRISPMQAMFRKPGPVLR
jgi:4-amino-4-deoxy-L-arabinose transferase-like glycosyltransferase